MIIRSIIFHEHACNELNELILFTKEGELSKLEDQTFDYGNVPIEIHNQV